MTNWFANLFSSGAAKVVDSLGTAIDNLVTSDEERLKMKAIIEKEMYSFEREQLAAMADYDKEISKRHETDMRSGSWLARNIRPLVLLFLTVSTVILAYLTIFILDDDSVNLITPWVDLLQMLLITAYGFYFSGRSYEKAVAHKNK